MGKVFTRLDDVTIQRIEETGSTVYSFLQEAVREKLENRKTLFVEAIVEQNRRNLKNDLEKMIELMEERTLLVVSSCQNLLQESIAKDENYKIQTLENLKKILAHIKETK